MSRITTNRKLTLQHMQRIKFEDNRNIHSVIVDSINERAMLLRLSGQMTSD